LAWEFIERASGSVVRELLVGLALQLFLGFVELAHLLAQLLDLVRQSLGLSLDLCGLHAIGGAPWRRGSAGYSARSAACACRAR
jgi:hypothetical protein